MRRFSLFLLSGAVIAGTVAAVTSTVSDASGNTTVTVSRTTSDPPKYTVTICTKGKCPTTSPSGEYTVAVGGSQIHFKKLIGGWGYRAKTPGGAWIGGGYESTEWKNRTVNGVDWCCMSTAPLSPAELGGDPATPQPGVPAPGQTTYTVPFSMTGNATTGTGTLGWIESDA